MVEKKRGRPPGSIARYTVVSEDIARRLASGEWPVGSALPSCRIFGREYGVGAHVINRALRELARNGRVLISPRRLPVAALGAPLESVLQHAIAVVLRTDAASTFAGTLATDIREGLERAVSQSGCSPLLYLHHPNRWRTEFPIGLADLPLRGVLLLGPFTTAMIHRYEILKVPVVVVDQPAEKCAVHTVTAANFDASFDATTRLIALGHRRLAFIRAIIGSLKDIDPDAKERQEGFVAACQEAGLPEQDYKVFTAAYGRNSVAVQSLMRSVPRFTAVLSANDSHARQVWSLASTMGLQVPHDLSIAVFRQRLQSDRDWSGPEIDFLKIGHAAVTLLTQKHATPQRVRIPCVWKNGTTVGRARNAGH